MKRFFGFLFKKFNRSGLIITPITGQMAKMAESSEKPSSYLRELSKVLKKGEINNPLVDELFTIEVLQFGKWDDNSFDELSQTARNLSDFVRL